MEMPDDATARGRQLHEHRGPGAARVAHTALSLALIGVCFVTAAWLVSTLTWPFGWDQGIFAWAGSVILEGGLPYRDAVDLKGPLPYYVYAAVQALLGHNTWGIRLLDAIAMMTGAAALRAVVVQAENPSAGSWAGCALILWVGSLGFWGTAQPDGWVAILMTTSVAVLFGTVPTAASTRIVISAFLAGLSVLVKPFYIGLALLPLAYVWIPSLVGSEYIQLVEAPRRFRASALAIGAAALPAVLAIGWFSANGALGVAIDVHIRYSGQAYSDLGDLALVGRFRGMLHLFRRDPILMFALPAIAAGVLSSWRTSRRKTVVLVAWAILAFGFVLLQNRFYHYHLLPALPPLVAFGSIGFATILRSTTAASIGPANRVAGAVRIFAGVSFALVLVQLAARPAGDILRAAKYAVGFTAADEYYSRHAPMASFNAADNLAIAHALRSRSHPDDRVAVLGYNAGILYLANRRSASRFGFSYPFTHDTTTVLTRQFQDEFIGTIRARPPEWILVGAIDGARVSLERRLESHPRLAAVIAQRYCVDEVIGHYVLFRLCPDASGAVPYGASGAADM
jgi:hypothetical protein